MGLPPAALALALGLPLVLGCALLRLLGVAWRSDRLAYLGWAWIAGACGTALVVFGWLWSGLARDVALVPDVLVLAAAVLAWQVGRRRPVEDLGVASPGGERGPRPERALFALVLAAVLLLTLARVLLGTLHPIVTDDEGNFWAMKAKVAFLQGFTPGFGATLREPNFVYNADYPNLNPLLQVWTFAHAGGIVHVANRLPIQLFALAQVLVAAAALRRVVRPGLAAALLLVLVAPAEALFQTRLAHGDLLVGLGALVVLDAWLRWRATATPAAFRLLALGLALMLGSKNEGLMYVACIALALGLARLLAPGTEPARAPRAPLRWLLLPLAVLVAGWAFNAWFGFSSGFLANERREAGMLTLAVTQLGERFPLVAGHLLREVLLSPAHSGLVLAAVLLAAPVSWLRREVLVPALALALALGGIAVVFLGAPHDVRWHLDTAAARVTFQLFPAAVLSLGLLVAASASAGGAGAEPATPAGARGCAS